MIPIFGRVKRGRVFFKSDTLTGGSEFSEPAEPPFPLAGANGEGFFWYPQVGDQIEVLIDVANEHPIPRILRMVYSSEDEPNSEFTEDEPFNMGWASRLGHILIFGNNPTKPFVKLAHGDGSFLKWEKTVSEGVKETHTVKGVQEEIFEGKINRTMQDIVEETFKAEVKRIQTGKLDELFKSDVTRTVQGNFTNKIKGDWILDIIKSLTFTASGGATLKLGQGKVALGTSTNETLDLIDQFIAEVDKLLDEVNTTLTNIQAITVPTSVGPSGPPTNSAAFAASATVLATIKTALGTIKTNLNTIKGSI